MISYWMIFIGVIIGIVIGAVIVTVFDTFGTFFSKTIYYAKKLKAKQVWGLFIVLVAFIIGLYFREELFLYNPAGTIAADSGIVEQVIKEPVFQGIRIFLYIFIWFVIIKLPFINYKSIGFKTPYAELNMEAKLSESAAVKTAMLNEVSVALMGILRLLSNATVNEMIEDIKSIGKEITDSYFIESITKVINIQFKLYNIRKTHCDHLMVNNQSTSYTEIPVVYRAVLKELSQESIVNKEFRISDDASIMVVPLLFRGEVGAIIYIRSEKYLLQQIDAMIIDSIWNNICQNNESLKILVINSTIDL